MSSHSTSSDAYKNYGFTGISHSATTGSICTVENNIFCVGVLGASDVLWWYWLERGLRPQFDLRRPDGPHSGGNVSGDPKFVSTDPNNANAFRLSAGSPATDVGAALPVYQDYAGTARPQEGAGMDIGAFEFMP